MQKKRAEYDALMEKQKSEFELEKIQTEIRERAEQERANEDLNLRKAAAQAEMDSKRVVKGTSL